MYEEWLNRIALSIVLRNSSRNGHALIDMYGSATLAIAQRPDIFEGKIAQARCLAEKEVKFIEKHKIRPYFYKDDNYPYRLANCVDAPLILYAKGNVNVNPKHALSVVGTRMPTERGKDLCRRMILDMAASVSDLAIISGLAYGIDVIAHKAALEAGIPTIIIPAHGLDRIYPSVHRSVAVQSLESGGILTEYTTGTTPERFNFVARNRIIAGMADAILVVESKLKGGSLITAEMGVDYGRDVFAMPGRVDDAISAGCNDLIKRNKAQLVESADDLISAMQWQRENKEPIQTQLLEMMLEVTPSQQLLINLLRESEEGMHINQLVLETQLAYNVVSSELILLELNDVVKSMPGGMWRIKK